MRIEDESAPDGPEPPVLDVDRVIRLADALAGGGAVIARFHMGAYILFRDGRTTVDVEEARRRFSEATAACLAGHTVTLFMDAAVATTNIGAAAAELLGLDENQALDLFQPSRELRDCVTPEQAAGTLRFLAVTGRVLWPTRSDKI